MEKVFTTELPVGVIEIRTRAFIRSVLPALNANGDLPAGIHVAGWQEIEQRFGTRTDSRARAFAMLQRLHGLASRTGLLKSFYVFGSFVSDKPDPQDVDVILVMNEAFELARCPGEARPLFLHAVAQARYGATVFWLREGALSPDAMDDYLRVWQVKRDGVLRGILELA